MGPKGRSGGFTLIELLIVVAIIGIIAAIAIPSLLRARIAANEVAAIGDVRSVVSAEHAYAASNGATFGTIACLGTPSGCGFAPGTLPFVDIQIASVATKQGYARTFLPGTASAGMPDPGISTFVYGATPSVVGQTGNRGFAADHSGVICFTVTGVMPATTGPWIALSPTCTPLK